MAGTTSKAHQQGRNEDEFRKVRQDYLTRLVHENKRFNNLCRETARFKAIVEANLRTLRWKLMCLGKEYRLVEIPLSMEETLRNQSRYRNNLPVEVEIQEMKRMFERMNDEVERANPLQTGLHKAKQEAKKRSSVPPAVGRTNPLQTGLHEAKNAATRRSSVPPASPAMSEATIQNADHAKALHANYEPIAQSDVSESTAPSEIQQTKGDSSMLEAAVSETAARQPTIPDFAAEFVLQELDKIFNSVLASFAVIRKDSISPLPIEKLVLRMGLIRSRNAEP